MSSIFSRRLSAWVAAALLLPAAALLSANDWPEWRGAARTGVSAETGLPESWSPAGENLAWKAPYGGRSAPVVFGDRLYLQNGVGSGADLQERLVAFNADTGEVLWEHRYNIYTSDVPPHRIAWASPAVDPATGHIFVFSGNGHLFAFSPEGKVLWERSLAEEFGMWTTHGGRVSSPIVDGDQLIVSGLMFLWGQHSNGAHRYVSFDKATGKAIWMSSPEGRPTDTIYANPFVGMVNGVRTVFSGGSDGAMHAFKAANGEPIWNWRVSQRGLNTAALVVGDDVIVTHSEENVGSNDMGMVAAVPANSKGTLTDKDARWLVRGIQVGYPSPVSDGQRLYALDNGGVLFALDLKTGAQLWRMHLGTIAKASPIYADGKLYVGTENTGNAGGKFYIIRPHADRGEILDEDWLGTPEASQLIIGSPIAARGRIYVVSDTTLYAIGSKGAPGGAAKPAPAGGGSAAQGSGPAGPVASLVVSPTEHLIKPGEALQLEVRAFDAQGRIVTKPGATKWELEGLRGTLENGRFTPAPGIGQAGLVKATIGSANGAARIRVVPDLPWTYDFEQHEGTAPPPYWINATGKFEVRDMEGGKVLVKLANNAFAFAKRTRPFFGSTEFRDYTIQADVRSMEVRRQMSDVGIVAQRYELVLFGNHQRLELQPWQPETERTVRVKFPWEKDTWYTMKLEVQTLDKGRVRARGKVWPRGEAEPEAWTIERIDPLGSLRGSPGIYADALNSAPQGGSEIYYDNIKVYRNK